MITSSRVLMLLNSIIFSGACQGAGTTTATAATAAAAAAATATTATTTTTPTLITPNSD